MRTPESARMRSATRMRTVRSVTTGSATAPWKRARAFGVFPELVYMSVTDTHGYTGYTGYTDPDRTSRVSCVSRVSVTISAGPFDDEDHAVHVDDLHAGVRGDGHAARRGAPRLVPELHLAAHRVGQHFRRDRAFEADEVLRGLRGRGLVGPRHAAVEPQRSDGRGDSHDDGDDGRPLAEEAEVGREERERAHEEEHGRGHGHEEAGHERLGQEEQDAEDDQAVADAGELDHLGRR